MSLGPDPEEKSTPQSSARTQSSHLMAVSPLALSMGHLGWTLLLATLVPLNTNLTIPSPSPTTCERTGRTYMTWEGISVLKWTSYMRSRAYLGEATLHLHAHPHQYGYFTESWHQGDVDIRLHPPQETWRGQYSVIASHLAFTTPDRK